MRPAQGVACQHVRAGDVRDEHRARGAIERTYRLRRARAAIDADTAASASRDDHRRVFAVAMRHLISPILFPAGEPAAG